MAVAPKIAKVITTITSAIMSRIRTVKSPLASTQRVDVDRLVV